jgi:hypothetical protein
LLFIVERKILDVKRSSKSQAFSQKFTFSKQSGGAKNTHEYSF